MALKMPSHYNTIIFFNNLKQILEIRGKRKRDKNSSPSTNFWIATPLSEARNDEQLAVPLKENNVEQASCPIQRTKFTLVRSPFRRFQRHLPSSGGFRAIYNY